MFILGIAFIILIEEFLETYSVIIGVTGLLCRYTLNPPTPPDTPKGGLSDS
jgi:hypothetical protein